MSPSPAPYDGTLASWEEIKHKEDWDALILGNGMSINVWGDFNYESLYERATQETFLTKKERALFERLETRNFEEVLRKLSDAILIGRAIREPRPTERQLHASVQKALAQAVQAVHVRQGEIPLDSLEQIRAEFRLYRHVFTTSYDLLAYWAAAKGPEERPFEGFHDFFWAHQRNAFDESTIRLLPAAPSTRLYFLHGALHLVVVGGGTTCKRAASFFGLLDKFGRPFKGDHTARPLIVTEASANDKLQSITANAYLSYCWRVLAELDCPVVVFGQSLAEQDGHLVDALNQHRRRPVAVSIRGGGRKSRIASEQHRIASLLRTRRLYFYRASSHPLGRKGLKVAS